MRERAGRLCYPGTRSPSTLLPHRALRADRATPTRCSGPPERSGLIFEKLFLQYSIIQFRKVYIMDDSRDYTEDAIQPASEITPAPMTVQLLATIKGNDDNGDLITVETPNGPFPVGSGDQMNNCAIITFPTSELIAFAQFTHQSIPVLVYDEQKAVPPPQGPQVRVILSNAIITSDGDTAVGSGCRIELYGKIKAIGTAEEKVILLTPNGSTALKAADHAREYPIYSVEQSAFTASDDEGSLPVYLYDGRTGVPPMGPSECQVIFTELTVTL